MKKLTVFLLSSVLMFGAVACSNSKTSETAPDSTKEAPQAPKAEDVQKTKEDAQSDVRRKQLNADIKAREERNNVTGGNANKAEGDIESEVRSKLEANIPEGTLTVKAEDNGAVVVSGTVPKKEQLAKIDKLAKEIKGVKTVTVKATVAAPKSDKKS